MNHVSFMDSLHIVLRETTAQTLNESQIEQSWDLGNDVTVHIGYRNGIPIFVMENSSGELDVIIHNAA